MRTLFRTYHVLISPIARCITAYMAWVVAHYSATHAYAQLCTPLSFMGLAMSPFVSGSPHCRALRWCIVNGTSNIDAMWIGLGTWALSFLLFPPYTRAVKSGGQFYPGKE